MMSSVLEDNGVELYPEIYTVTRFGVEVSLSPMQYRMLEMIAASRVGVTPEMLFERLYVGIDSPLTGRRVLHNQRVHANHKLAAIKMQISSSRGRHGGPGSFYRLVAEGVTDESPQSRDLHRQGRRPQSHDGGGI
jgi:hypothetical protein